MLHKGEGHVRRALDGVRELAGKLSWVPSPSLQAPPVAAKPPPVHHNYAHPHHFMGHPTLKEQEKEEFSQLMTGTLMCWLVYLLI